MEERRKGDRRDPDARDALSPDVLRLLRVCGASVRSADEPEELRTGAPTDRRRGAVPRREHEGKSRSESR